MLTAVITLAAACGSSKATLAGSSTPAVPKVTASPSDQLRPSQMVEVTLTGFPPDTTVQLGECPSFRVPPTLQCSTAPAQTVLTTDLHGSAAGGFQVEFASLALLRAFDQGKCAVICYLVATTTTGPVVSASTVISFAQPPIEPPPTMVAEPPGFGVAAASFITPDQGWALGSTGCPGCAGVVTTADGGRTWTSLPPPPSTLYWYNQNAAAVSDIRFANPSDGYLFDPGLYATTDGGRTWVPEQPTNVLSLAIAGDYAYALTRYDSERPESLYRARIGTSVWRGVPLPTAAASASFRIAAAGSDLVLLETGWSGPGLTPDRVGRLWLGASGTSAGVSWKPRTMPCTVPDGGAAVIGIAYGHPRAWLVVCYDNEQSSQEQQTLQHIYGTADGGASWTRLSDPPQHGAPERVADNGAGHAFLATDGGMDMLNGTLDGGRTWSASLGDGGSFSGWGDLVFVNTQTGYVVGPADGRGDHLYRTTDGGGTWTTVAIQPGRG